VDCERNTGGSDAVMTIAMARIHFLNIERPIDDEAQPWRSRRGCTRMITGSRKSKEG